jgi:hypothetical protein
VGTSERYPVGGAVLNEYLNHALRSRSICLSNEHVQRVKEMCAEVADSQDLFAEMLAMRQSHSTHVAATPSAAEAAPGDAAQSTLPGGPTTHVLPDGQEITIEGEGCVSVLMRFPLHIPSVSCSVATKH